MIVKEVKMSSLEVVELINDYRKMEGKSKELVHSDFMKKVRKELDTLKSLRSVEVDDFFINSKYIDKQGKERPCFEISKKGMKYLMDLEKSSDKIAIQKAYVKLGGGEDTIFCIDRFEDNFFTKLGQTLRAMNIKIDLEKHISIKNKSYRLDGYLPDYNLAIEYDERQHYVEPQKSRDINRERKIKKEIKCNFLRLDYKNTDCFNIGLVLNYICKQIRE